MTLPTIQERLANLSAVGMTKEVTFGTPLAATNFVPDTMCDFTTDPGLFYPKVMQGQRDEQIWGLYGEFKRAGKIEGPLFPLNGIPLLFGAIGQDGGQGVATGVTLGNGVTGSNGNTKTGTLGALTAGATGATYTLSTGGAPTTNDLFQIDVNLAGVTSSEVRKLTNVTGAGPYTLTFDQPINFNHAAAAPAKNVIAPFTHTAVPTNFLPSFTIEKNVGGFESLQYAGARVNKFDLKAETGNKEASFTADMLALAEAVMTTPTAISVDTATPFVFAEYSLSLFAQALTQANKFSFAIDNGVKATPTMASVHGPSFITPTTRKVSGSLSLVYTSFDDATYGYFNKMLAFTQGAITFTLAHPANGGSVAINMPQCKIAKYGDDIKIGDIVITNLTYEAELQLSSGQSVTATVINSAYLPY